jgi:hypothetical protein
LLAASVHKPAVSRNQPKPVSRNKCKFKLFLLTGLVTAGFCYMVSANCYKSIAGCQRAQVAVSRNQPKPVSRNKYKFKRILLPGLVTAACCAGFCYMVSANCYKSIAGFHSCQRAQVVVSRNQPKPVSRNKCKFKLCLLTGSMCMWTAPCAR